MGAKTGVELQKKTQDTVHWGGGEKKANSGMDEGTRRTNNVGRPNNATSQSRDEERCKVSRKASGTSVNGQGGRKTGIL